MNQLTEIANSLDTEEIIKIVTQLGADRYQKSGDAIIFPTICHHTDSLNAKMKLYYYPSTHLFHCYTDCGCSFNIYDLFKKRYELLNQEYDFYRDILLKINSPSLHHEKYSELVDKYESIYTIENHNTTVKMKILDKGLLNIYDKIYTSEWIKDGVTVEAMKTFNIRYSVLENKIIIPHYDVNNNLIGIRGRSLNEKDILFGKYMPVTINNKILSHPLGYNLYGLNLNKDNIKRKKIAILSEGEKSVLQFESMYGRENNIVVAVCGNSFHKYQLDLLKKCGAEKILIAFDKSGKNLEEKEKAFCKLKDICKKYKNYCTMGFIYDFDNLLELKQSPFDCGKNIFEQLFKKGVWL